MTLPSLACDCHVHLFGPAARYPFAPTRAYTPGDADEVVLDTLHRQLGIARVVVVQPSVYGTDNSRLLDGLHALGPRARGVAVIDDDIDDASLQALHDAGVRGVRVNVTTNDVSDPDDIWRRIAAQAARVAPLGWHVQVLAKASLLAALAARIATLPCQLVADHFGHPDLAAGPSGADFQAILSLVRAGHLTVKLSAMERLTGPGRLRVLAPFITALAEANPQGVVWGSDWPHTGGGRGLGPGGARPLSEIEPFQAMDDQNAIDAVLSSLADHALRQALFVGNPTRLYGFAHGASA